MMALADALCIFATPVCLVQLWRVLNKCETLESLSALDGFCLLCAESAERLDDGFLLFKMQRCDRRKSGSEPVTRVRPEAHHRARLSVAQTRFCCWHWANHLHSHVARPRQPHQGGQP